MYISFRGRKDLRGTLSQSFKELKGLSGLDLGDTKISGDLAVLANCTKMTKLKLQNTLVSGNLAALAEARIFFLDLSNSKVTGDLGALSGAKLAFGTPLQHQDRWRCGSPWHLDLDQGSGPQ